MIVDTEYIQWLSNLKKRFRQSQAKAVVRLNQSMLEFYWSLGRDIVALKAESKWGSNFFNQLSIDLQQTFPRQKGFSVTNLKYVKRWYQFYYEQIRIRQQAADELQAEKFYLPEGDIRQQAADELELPEKFAFVPLYHHVPTVGLIICKSTDKTVVEWSLKDICKPLGVATYQLEEVVERTVKEFELNNK